MNMPRSLARAAARTAPARVQVRSIEPGMDFGGPTYGRTWAAVLYRGAVPMQAVLCATHARAIETAGHLLREAAAEAAGLTYVRLP